MDKLTWECMYGGIYVDADAITKADIDGFAAYCGSAVNALASYESSGLTPDEVKELSQKAQNGEYFNAPELAKITVGLQELKRLRRTLTNIEYVLDRFSAEHNMTMGMLPEAAQLYDEIANILNKQVAVRAGEV